MADERVRRQVPRFGALLWACCFQYFVAEQIARMAWTLPYSIRRNYISDLGAVHCSGTTAGIVCSPLHLLMNCSFVLQGVLIVFGTIFVRRAFPKSALMTLALVCIGGSGLGVLGVGLAPEDLNSSVHYAAAAEHFLLDNLGMALLGTGLLLQPEPRRVYAFYSCASGLIGLAATVLLSQKLFLGLQVGGMERVGAYPFPLWLTLTGLLLLIKKNKSRSG